MFKRLMLGLVGAMLTAPVMYAAAQPFAAPPSNVPWERLSRAAADAICRHLGLCFDWLP